MSHLLESSASRPRPFRIRTLLGFLLLGIAGLTSLPWAVRQLDPRWSEILAVPAHASTEETAPDAVNFADDTSGAVDRTQHLKRLGVDRWHAAGRRGKGVKIAVLDSGFCGYRAQLGKALPAQVTARSFRPDGNLEARDSQHGILCAEVIHAIAPDAELLFANWEANNPQQFLEAIKWARDQGARVLSCSLIMPSWSDAEGNGDIHDELTKLLGRGTGEKDLLCFVCAGNTAERHWSGKVNLDDNGMHQWATGSTENVITPWGSERISVELCGVNGAECEIIVTDTTTDETVGRATAKTEQPCASVRYYPRTGHTYTLRLRRLGGDKGAFHLFVLGGALKHSTAQGSICFPGDGPEVITIGAVDHEGNRASYSSCGPNSKHLKPDLVAPVPFSSQWRARPFAGTSAATPQAAALAGLIWAHNPDWKADRVRGQMKDTAHDVGPQGHDWETGHGIVRLPSLR